jgi:hypothetical protein
MLGRFVLATGLALIGAGPGFAKDCRDQDAPPGVRVPLAAGCEPANAAKESTGRLKTGREPGFSDLGNGTQVRIGGRVRAEIGTRR